MMIDISKHKAGIGLAVFCILILIAAVFVSMRASNSSKDVEKRLAYSIKALQQNVDQLESRVEEFEELLQESRKENQVTLQSSATTPSELKKEDPQVSKFNITTMKSEKGEDPASITADMDKEVLKDMYDEAARKKSITNQQQILRKINLEQREMDKELYDNAAEDLLKQAISSIIGKNIGDEEREQVLNNLLTRYPDSYAAAKAVSLEVMNSVRKNDIERAEEYYDMLIDMQSIKSESVVLDSGLEAVPAVSNVLAYSYYRAGRTDKIEPIINHLEANYSDSLISIRIPRGGRRVVTGEEAIDRLRRVTGVY